MKTDSRPDRTKLLLLNGQLQRDSFFESPVPKAVVDAQGYPLHINTAMQRFWGYSDAEIMRMSFPEFTHPDDAKADEKMFQELVDGNRRDYAMSKRWRHKEGHYVSGKLYVWGRYYEGEFVSYAEIRIDAKAIEIVSAEGGKIKIPTSAVLRAVQSLFQTVGSSAKPMQTSLTVSLLLVSLSLFFYVIYFIYSKL